jgi:hypothetical protein
MWAPGHHPERPWWALLSTKTATAAGAFVTWRRCDGHTLSAPWHPVTEWWGSPEQLRGAIMLAATAATGDELARIDREHPLPPPPPMPGQVWIVGDDEVVIGADTGKLIGVYAEPRHGAPLIGPPREPGKRFNGTPWPIPGAILVCGPGPWGANCPWMDTRGKA